MKNQIPKNIYYIWLGKNPLPQKIKKNLENWREKNPNFNIIRIDETNYDITKYKFVNDAYNDKNWAFASDLVRLDILYNYGGFYFDTDVYFEKSIDNLCHYSSVWAMENSGLINSGLIVGAKKGDKDLENLLSIYKKKVYDKKKLDKLITVRILSKYFSKCGLKTKNEIQVLKKDQIIFPSEYFAPFHWWGGGKKTKNTIAVQQYLNSWSGENKKSWLFRQKQNLRLYFPKIFSLLKSQKEKLK